MAEINLQDLCINAKNAVVQAHQNLRKEKESRKRDNIIQIDRAITHLYEECTKDLVDKVETASKQGYSNIKLFLAKKYDKYDNFPVIFLLMGSKFEGLNVFDNLGIISLEKRLLNKFLNTQFSIKILPVPNKDQQPSNRLAVYLYWK